MPEHVSRYKLRALAPTVLSPTVANLRRFVGATGKCATGPASLPLELCAPLRRNSVTTLLPTFQKLALKDTKFGRFRNPEGARKAADNLMTQGEACSQLIRQGC